MLARTRRLPLALSVILVSSVAVACSSAPAHRPGPAATGSPAATTTAVTPPPAPVGSASWVTAENARPGTPNWRIPASLGAAPGLDAYADRVSVLPGEPVGLAVDGRGRVAVRALRIGWYGGAGARTVWTGGLTAHRQPAPHALTGPIPDAGGLTGSRAVVAGWPASLTVDTRGWPEGEYLFRLDAGGASRYVPLTIRSASAAGRELLVAGVMTWQAYNTWGGRSLYGDTNRRLANRSYAVSFDRPYHDGAGAGRFLGFDAPVVQLAERAGVPLAYTTDLDLATDPSSVAGAAAVVFGGHAEYWTPAMRAAVVRAGALGANLAFLGANTAYWRVRLAGRSGAGDPRPADRRDGRPRLVVGTKDPGLDPLARTDPEGTTTKFHDAPAPVREETLTGLRYDCFPVEGALSVADPSWWGWAGTGVRGGQRLGGVVGPEIDRAYPVPGRPAPEQIVAYSPVGCDGHATAQTSVYWVARSGAGVFAAGTMRWACAGTRACSAIRDPRVADVIGRVTMNVLREFARPKAGLRRPATDTVGRYHLAPVNTTGRV